MMEVLGCVCFVCRLDSDVWPDGVERLNNTLLFLRPLQRNDSGVYRCEVANSIDLRSRDLRILIQGESPPRRPRPLPGTPRPSDHAPSRAHPIHQTKPTLADAHQTTPTLVHVCHTTPTIAHVRQATPTSVHVPSDHAHS